MHGIYRTLDILDYIRLHDAAFIYFTLVEDHFTILKTDSLQLRWFVLPTHSAWAKLQDSDEKKKEEKEKKEEKVVKKLGCRPKRISFPSLRARSNGNIWQYKSLPVQNHAVGFWLRKKAGSDSSDDSSDDKKKKAQLAVKSDEHHPWCPVTSWTLLGLQHTIGGPFPVKETGHVDLRLKSDQAFLSACESAQSQRWPSRPKRKLKRRKRSEAPEVASGQRWEPANLYLRSIRKITKTLETFGIYMFLIIEKGVVWLTNMRGPERRLWRVLDTVVAFIKTSALLRLLQQESEEESFSKLGPWFWSWKPFL